jgi:hypothetical protein
MPVAGLEMPVQSPATTTHCWNLGRLCREVARVSEGGSELNLEHCLNSSKIGLDVCKKKRRLRFMACEPWKFNRFWP